jgi:hypothetical protein
VLVTMTYTFFETERGKLVIFAGSWLIAMSSTTVSIKPHATPDKFACLNA